MIFIYFGALLASFVLLFKCADVFIDGSVGLAHVFNIPKLIVGIVLVGLATTAPEFAVSVQAAFLGHSEISLGNAVGSVICDDGIAMALAGLVATTAIVVNCRVLRIVGSFLLGIDFLAFILVRNGEVSRLEGMILLLLLIPYFLIIIFLQRRKKGFLPGQEKQNKEPVPLSDQTRRKLIRKHVFYFIGGIIGVVITSRVIIWAAVRISIQFSISETIIGLTVIAIGTSLPEISTAITAARKGEGEIAVGNILGADVLNILWIIGMSAVVRPIVVDQQVIGFTFPFMILIVTVMLVLMRFRCRFGKIKGVVLLGLYAVYFLWTLFFLL
ncbi:MAG: calcium/sodium antiporter [Candidatus Aminicenantes bacterium]|nr:calcium/sodium antiporter [Candidatus Aminicenantes bacterium]